MMVKTPVWHKIGYQQAAELLGSDPERGLTDEEAERRTQPHSRLWAWSILRRCFFNQLNSVTAPLLLAAIVLLFRLEEPSSAAVAAAILLLRLGMGTVLEWLAVRGENRLKDFNQSFCQVIRNGRQQSLPDNRLVLGDLVLLSEGSLVPATLRLVRSKRLQVEQQNGKGRVITLEKEAEVCLPEKTKVEARKNMLYYGQTVTAGSGLGLVVAAAVDARPGEKLATNQLLRLAGIEWLLALGAIAATLLVTYTGLQSGEIIYQIVVTGTALAVASMPVVLLPVAHMTQVYWSRRLTQEGIAIRHSSILAKLARITMIICDHSGILTGAARVEQVITTAGVMSCGEREEPVGEGVKWDFRRNQLMDMSLQVALLCHLPVPSLLARALSAAAEQKGLTPERIRDEFGERLDATPLSCSDCPKSVLHRRRGRSILMVSGSLEQVMERCQRIDTGNRTVPLTPSERERWHKQGEEMASRGQKVLALAYREFPWRCDRIAPGYAEPVGLTWLGLLAVSYSFKPGVALAIKQAKQAGIDTRLVTEEDPTATGHLGEELGLLEDGGSVLSGRELGGSERDLARSISRSRVIAGILPEQRLAIVKACRRAGEVVACIGGNLTDTPAVEAAEVGVVSGLKPTPLEKETADLVIPGGDLIKVLRGVAVARGAGDNVKRLLGYAISCSLGVIMTVLLPLIAGFPLTLLPIQLLWVNLVSSSLPAIAIAMEPPDTGVMAVPPALRGKKILTGGIILKSLGLGCLIGFSSAAVFGWLLGGHGDLGSARCGAFLTLALAQLFQLWVWRGRGVRNPWRMAVLVAGLLLILPTISGVPTLNINLSGGDWLAVLLGAGLVVAIDSLPRLVGWVRNRKSSVGRL